MQTTSGSRGVVERYVAAVAAGDAEGVRASFADDATWELGGELPISGVWRGRAAIVDGFLAAALGYYEPGSVSIEVTGVVEWTSRARTRAGRPYENRCIGVFTVRDGRIQGVREYMDTACAERTAFAPRG